jgi:hypothetical protein
MQNFLHGCCAQGQSRALVPHFCKLIQVHASAAKGCDFLIMEVKGNAYPDHSTRPALS